MSAGHESDRDPGEPRLLDYLEELREGPPATDTALVRRVQRSARWQAAVRGPLDLVGHLGGALADGITALLGRPQRKRR